MYNKQLRFYKKPKSTFVKVIESILSLFALRHIQIFTVSFVSIAIALIAIVPGLYNAQASNIDILDIDSSYSNKDVVIESKTGKFYLDTAKGRYFSIKNGDVWSVNLGKFEGNNQIKIGNYLDILGYKHLFETKKTIEVKRNYKLTDNFKISMPEYTTDGEVEYTLETAINKDNKINKITIKDGDNIIYEDNNYNNKCLLTVTGESKIFKCRYSFSKDDRSILESSKKIEKRFNFSATDQAGNFVKIDKDGIFSKTTAINKPKITCKPIISKPIEGENTLECLSNNDMKLEAYHQTKLINSDINMIGGTAYNIKLNMVEGDNSISLKGKDEFEQVVTSDFKVVAKKEEPKIKDNGRGVEIKNGNISFFIAPTNDTYNYTPNVENKIMIKITTNSQINIKSSLRATAIAKEPWAPIKPLDIQLSSDYNINKNTSSIEIPFSIKQAENTLKKDYIVDSLRINLNSSDGKIKAVCTIKFNKNANQVTDKNWFSSCTKS